MRHRRQGRPQLWLERETKGKLRTGDIVAVRCLQPESGGYSYRSSISHLKMESNRVWWL